MQAHVENILASSTLCMRRVGQYGEENVRLMEKMKQWVRNNSLWNESGAIYGIAQDNPTVTPPDKCRYDVCFITEKTIEDGFVHRGTLPEGKYLVFQVLHTSDDVQRFWSEFVNAVVKKKQQFDETRPILERYQFVLVENGYCEFCVPIL